MQTVLRFVLLASLFLSTGFTGDLEDCFVDGSPRYYKESSDLAFFGKVTEVKRTGAQWNESSKDTVHFLNFKVIAGWKGPEEKTFEIVAGWLVTDDPATFRNSKKLPFKIGNTYMVFAQKDIRDDGLPYYYTSTCLGSKQVSEEHDDLLKLMLGEPPKWRP